MAEKLDITQVDERLANIPGWSLQDDKLHRDFKFDNFVHAFGFMTSVAMEAEKMDHHPEWSNVYNRVSVDLVTHSAGGITELDFVLAEKMNVLAAAGRS